MNKARKITELSCAILMAILTIPIIVQLYNVGNELITTGKILDQSIVDICSVGIYCCALAIVLIIIYACVNMILDAIE
jgi:hypothetical protein